MANASPRGDRSRVRAIASVAAGTIGVAAILIAGLIAFASRALFQSGPFADRVAASLGDPRVASFVAARVTDRLLEQKPDLTAFRPIILATSEAVVASAPTRAVVRRAARRAHDLVMSQGTQGVLLSVDDVGVILRSALATQPELAEKIPKDASAVVASLSEAPALRTAAALLRFGPEIRAAGLSVFLLGVVLVFVSVGLAPARRVALLANGVALVGVATVVLVIARFGGPGLSLLAADKELGRALAGVWEAFAGGLIPRALAIGGTGILFAAAAASVLERVRLDALARAAAQWLWRPRERRGAALLRAIVLIVTGGVAVMSPQLAVSVIAIVLGVVIVFMGLEELFRLVVPALPVRVGEAQVTTGVRRASRIGLAAAAAALIVVAVGVGVTLMGRSEAAAEATTRTIEYCNGYAELCDRPLDRVVFPATHNAMAAAEIADWMFPNHERRIPAQLEAGIRAFMIDVHSGVPVAGRVKTDMESEETQRAKYEAVLGPEGMEAALRIRNRLVGEEEGPHGPYLCHGFCELGAEPLVPLLAEVREFLVANPHEVIILIVEDPGANAQQMDSAFQASGLIDFVYRGPTSPWPTLREMIASDGRVLALSENDWPGVSWYHPASEVLQDTPYSFKDPSEFSCRPNRGERSNPLFVVNHWIDTSPAPLPSKAEEVNAYDVLLARARQCQRQRGKLPNIIAVDFYQRGDVVGVARTLNRVREPAAESP